MESLPSLPPIGLCACNDPTGKCIMASMAPVGVSSTQWSNCSLADMEASFAMYPATKSCLYNEPAEAAILPSYTGHGKHDTAVTLRIFLTVLLCFRCYCEVLCSNYRTLYNYCSFFCKKLMNCTKLMIRRKSVLIK